jgi:hypothetical protein
MKKLARPLALLLLLSIPLWSGAALWGQTAEEPEGGQTVPAPAEGEAEPAAEQPPAEQPAGEQPAEVQLSEEEAREAAKKAAENSILEMDINTSSIFELASWCRSLGLSESGGREELASRLRNHFALAPPAADSPEGAKQRTIIIESARSTEYFTLEVVDEEYARLRGDVLVSLKDGEAVHRIQAWEILYNRTRNSLSATGGVEYEKIDGDTRETFRGESITVDLDTWATIFMGGVSERSLSSGETAYRFSGTLITRSDEEVTILTRAEISNADVSADESYWSLSASKLWLLPGSDFAVMNAILKVGEIPVLYIPFFFFPTSEIVFHPVVGTRSREGAFFQTTTYLLGRPVAASTSESSITKILGNSSDNEKVREGVFLRSTGRKTRDPNDTRLSLLFDAYANLGYYLGTELALPQKGVLGPQEFSFGLGLTRTVFRNVESNYYSPFEQGESQWNSARIFSETIPLRFRLNTGGSLSGKYGSLSWTFPFYSDPYVNRDFMNRSEEMDWVAMLKSGASLTEEETISNRLGTYEWRLNGSLRPTLNLRPYITELSLSSISSTMSFQTRQTTANIGIYDPNYYFFFPDKFTIVSLSGTIQGTPLSLGGSGGTANPAANGETPADPLRNIGVPYSPWQEPGEEAGETGTPPWYELAPPVLTQQFSLPKTAGPHFTIDYRLSPSAASELQFRSSQARWSEVEKVDWGEISSILTNLKLDGGTTFRMADDNTGAYTISARLYGNATWQDYSLVNEESEDFNTDAKKDAAYLRVRNQTFFTTSSELISTVKPLYWSPVWGNSNLQYTLRNLFVKSVFNNSVDDPLWDLVYAKWDKDSLDSHQFAANIAASVMDKTQNISFVSDLPPKDPTITADAAFRIWITETRARQKILDPGGDPKFEPFTFTETLRFAPNYSAEQYFAYDPEKNEFTNLTSSLTLKYFTAAYTAIRSRTYELVPNMGWVASSGDEVFNPKEFRLGYAQNFTKAFFDSRLSFTVNLSTSLGFDLQRYTASRFNFSLGFTMGLSKFIDFSFNTTSENAVVFRYIQDLPFFDLPEELPGEKNFLIDLLNSFRFDDADLRKRSGFKLKTFRLALTHYLGDWTAKLGVTLSPYLDQANRVYKFNNEVSFIVQWTPITEIKTDLTYDKETYTIN